MSLGLILALLVLVAVLVGFLVGLPAWAVQAEIGALALAILLGGVVLPWRAP